MIDFLPFETAGRWWRRAMANQIMKKCSSNNYNYSRKEILG